MELRGVEKKSIVLEDKDIIAIGVVKNEYFSYVLHYWKGFVKPFFVTSASFEKGRFSMFGVTLRMVNGTTNEIATLSATTVWPYATDLTLLDISFYSFEKLVQTRYVKI